jgi:glycosyltransferase involved in cell wall biosynthesis
MRIGIFTYDFFPWEGGVGRHVFEIQEQLKRFKNIDIIIFSPCKNDLPNHKRLCAFSKIFGKNILFSLYVNIFIHRLIRKYNLDLLHFHAGSGGIFLIKKLKPRTIVTMHTNNYLFQYRRFGVISKFLLSPLEKRTYQIADQILPVSSYVEKNLINDYQIPKFKISVIPNGVNTDIFFPIPNLSNNDINILYVGRLYKGKGIEFLIDAVERLISDHPSLRLIVTGEGKYIKSLKRYIQAKTVCDHIVFLGWKDNWTLNKLYNKATVYVMPSIVEGFGLSLLEAMACKCPVIATDSGGSIDIIRHDYNGLLVSYGDTTQLATSINSLLKNKTKRNKFAHNGFETAQGFSWETIAKKLYFVYTQSDTGTFIGLHSRSQQRNNIIPLLP